MSKEKEKKISSDIDSQTGNFIKKEETSAQMSATLEKDLSRVTNCFATYDIDTKDPGETDTRKKDQIIDDIFIQVKENQKLLPLIKDYCEKHADSEYAISTVYKPLLEKLVNVVSQENI